MKITFPAIVTSALAASALLLAQTSAKNIFVSGGDKPTAGRETTPAVWYSLELVRNGSSRPVKASDHFQDGDRLRFRFKVNHPGYVYVVNRTLKGHPDSLENEVGSKGVIVRTGDKPTYTLLFPREDAGMQNRLSPGAEQQVPQQNWFELDREPGIEKMVLVVSPTKLDIGRYFNLSTGKAQPRRDSDDDVMGQLSKGFANANTEEPTTDSKGICVGDCGSYGAPRQSDKPMMISIDLRHYPAR